MFGTWGSIFGPFFRSGTKYLFGSFFVPASPQHFGTKYLFGSFFVPASPQHFLSDPAGHSKVPAKVPEDSRCWESVVYGSRPPIGSKPDSSPPKRPGLDNTTSQPWSDAICPCTTSTSAYLRFVTICLLEKTRQSTRSGGTGANCVRPWLTRDVV